MNTDTVVYLLIFQNMYHYFRMKNVNNFQTAKVQPRDPSACICSIFCQFQPGVTYESVAYKKAYIFTSAKIHS